jgi:acetyl-CoA synthetase
MGERAVAEDTEPGDEPMGSPARGAPAATTVPPLPPADDPVLARWAAAAHRLTWDRPWEQVVGPSPDGRGRPRWFPGGRLNLAVNAVHRHVPSRGDHVALYWEGEPGDRREVTFADLEREVVALADALASLGVGAGDRVALHLGLVPEAVVAMLACARLGAVHAVMPAVLPADALSDRLRDLAPRLLITQDGAWRHGVVLPLKSRADEALTAVGSVEHTVVVRRAGIDVPWFEGDRWYHELVAAPRPGAAAAHVPPVSVASDHPLLVVYVANRRGRPTGVVHGTGGYLTYCLETHRTLSPDDAGVTWTPAELVWLAAQSHGIFGPLLAGQAAVIYEGMLDTPTHGRAWEIVARYGVTTLVATPSVVRALRRWVDGSPLPEQVAALSVIVTAGEAIDADTERWLREEVGHGEAIVVNGWGQTELGAVVSLQPDPPGGGFPDAGLEVVDPDGAPLPPGRAGDLVLRRPWPGTALGVHGAPDLLPGRVEDRPGEHVTGDRARRREDGTIEYLGRSDRVFSVSGQLVSATEVKQVLEEHPFVTRAEAVDRPDPRTGRAVVACVEVAEGSSADARLAVELRAHVHDLLGGLSQPQSVLFVDRFPAHAPSEALVPALQRLAVTSEPVGRLTEEQVVTALTFTDGEAADASEGG